MFAGDALTGLLVNSTLATWDWEQFAGRAYELADAMLAAREREDDA